MKAEGVCWQRLRVLSENEIHEPRNGAMMERVAEDGCSVTLTRDIIADPALLRFSAVPEAHICPAVGAEKSRPTRSF